MLDTDVGAFSMLEGAVAEFRRVGPKIERRLAERPTAICGISRSFWSPKPATAYAL